MKLDLLTNAIVVEDAIRFVSTRSNYDEKIKSDGDKGDKVESEESDYDEDEDQLGEDQEDRT